MMAAPDGHQLPAIRLQRLDDLSAAGHFATMSCVEIYIFSPRPVRGKCGTKCVAWRHRMRCPAEIACCDFPKQLATVAPTAATASSMEPAKRANAPLQPVRGTHDLL